MSTIIIRKDIASLWNFYNPTLNLGEWALETDTGKVKLGDGSTIWTSLPYFIGTGNVTGPVSSTSGHVAIFNSTNGQLLSDSGLTLSGTNTGDQTTISGNAGTATALQTARTINGVSFDGTSNVTVTAAAGTLTGTTLASNVVNSSLTLDGGTANS